MCGITGIINNKLTDPLNKINFSISRLKDRGPDDSGIWKSENSSIYLGHTRLSIQDITNSGSQPMLSKCKKYVLIYNGEIYNFAELKKSLPKNILFHSNSDTELLLNCLVHNGIDLTCKLIDGMFSFCFYKIRENKIYFARDKFGEKPLYFKNDNKGFFFASTIDALKVYLSSKQNLNKNSINYYLRYGYVQSSDSIYEDINQLKPSEYIVLDTDQMKIIERVNYWKISSFGEYKSFTNTKALYKAIRKSVNDRLIGDVDIGCFLSGGFDSSLIAYIASKKLKNKLKTFSIGFEEEDYDESRNALSIAKFINSDHNQYFLSISELLRYIPEVSKAADQPLADSSFLPMLALCNLSSKSVKVCLSGDGADEMFAGYERYRRAILLQKLKPLNYITLKIILLINLFINKSGFFKNHQDRLIKIKSLLLTKNIEELYDEILCLGIGLDISKGVFVETINREKKENKNFDFLKYFLLKDLTHYLPEDLLIKADRASMRYSLEVRNPFLNEEILKIASSYPSSSLTDLRIGKKPLRTISNHIFPNNMILKKKKGFAVPLKYWLKKPLRDWADELINDSYLAKYNYINKSFLNKIYNEHKEGRRNWSHQIWGILIFEDWYRNNNY